MVNSPLYNKALFIGGVAWGGGTLDSHDFVCYPFLPPFKLTL